MYLLSCRDCVKRRAVTSNLLITVLTFNSAISDIASETLLSRVPIDRLYCGEIKEYHYQAAAAHLSIYPKACSVRASEMSNPDLMSGTKGRDSRQDGNLQLKTSRIYDEVFPTNTNISVSDGLEWLERGHHEGPVVLRVQQH